MESASSNNILIYLLDNSKFDILSKGANEIISFAKKIDILNMNNIPIQKTIQFLKSSENYRKKIAAFVKNADLYLDDFRYLSDKEVSLKFSVDDLNVSPQENALKLPDQLIDMFHLASYYKGMVVPSIIYDSTGTKKIAALAGYIIDALEQGKVLIIDELDNSLHFKLTRAIISIFNNELNESAQLICTVHDVSLLDCKRLFRKEQIWFTHKDEQRVYLYSLSEYTAEKDGIRNTTDIIDNYKKGVFGALPNPDLFESLMEVIKNE
jgi:ABC-type ATPase involved in cell division